MTKLEFFKLLERSDISRAEQNQLFRSMRRSIILFYLGRRQYERDRLQEDNYQQEIFEKILKSDAREFKKLIYELKLDEINLKLDAAKKKTPAHILARFILERKIIRFEKFLRIGWQDEEHFKKAAVRYKWILDRFEKKNVEKEEKKASGKNWKKGLVGVVVAVSLGVGAAVIYKKVKEKKEEKK